MDKSKIKIACIGNMNNNMFAIARHLLTKGYLADVILFGDEDHFLPESDTYEIEKYKKKFRTVDWLKKDLLSCDKKQIKNFLSDYNFIIACGISVAYLNVSKINVDLFIPYGSDLYDIPFALSETSTNPYYLRLAKFTAQHQKNGIENSSGILFDYTNDEFEAVFKKLKCKGIRSKLPAPFIDTNEFNIGNLGWLASNSKEFNNVKDLKLKYDCLILNHSRQCWKNPPDIWSYKGNERIIRAFAKLVQLKKHNPCLILFDYGPNVDDSKQLIKELNVEENVVWKTKLPRKEILSIISLIDIGVGEIGNYSWFSYGAIYEFLAMKKPVIHNRIDNLYQNHFNSLYPMYSAQNENMVFEHLANFYKDKEAFVKTGLEAHEWYKENAIEKPLNMIENLIKKSRTLNYKVKSLLK